MRADAAAAAREALDRRFRQNLMLGIDDAKWVLARLIALEAEVAVLKDLERLDIELRYAAATIDLVGRHRDEAIEERNKLRTEVAALRQDAERLLRFAGRILTVTRKEYGGGDVEGGDVQEWMLADGLLETRMVTEPCGESCVCAEWDEFPQDCHFLTALGDKALAALSPSAPTKEEEHQ